MRKDVKRLKAEYLPPEDYPKLFMLMQPANALALQITLETGLRIGDVLKARFADLNGDRMTVTAEKTGKRTVCQLRPQTVENILRLCPVGEYLFPGRKPETHRCRQAVYRDVRKAAEALRIPEHVSPHSARKTYAVKLRKSGVPERSIQSALQHSDVQTTRIYSRSDVLQLTPERLKELIETISDIVTERVLAKIVNSKNEKPPIS